jgi:hypothetical protein
MAKVYVSSTIVELEAERQAVIDWLWRRSIRSCTVTGPTVTRCGTVAWPTWTPVTCMC